jgi:hypothetical protein
MAPRCGRKPETGTGGQGLAALPAMKAHDDRYVTINQLRWW